MKIWQIIARHKDWVSGATITESENVIKTKPGGMAYRRFTATVRGFRNWKIFAGFLDEETAQKVQARVKAIRDKIDCGDEAIFNEVG